MARDTNSGNGLAGQVVFVTGAARGIGEATSRELVRRGARVVLADVDEAPLRALAAELGDAAVFAVCDVVDLPSVEAAVAVGVEAFGGIDVVLANAGIASYGSVQATDPATFRRLMDINVLGVFHTVRAALPSLISRRGYVLVVSSLAAFAPAPGLAAYNASKAGVEHFACALRLEVAHQGVEVGIAHMSWVDTPLVQDAKADLSAFAELISRLPGPLKRTIPVEECVAGFVRAIERRSRRVYVPGFVRIIGWLKPVVTSRLGEARTLQLVPELLPRMDAAVAALGRSTSARNVRRDV
ncbi:SDR family oxidoreductase [Nocardioides pacificus]